MTFDGYTDIPAGKIASVVTYLRMTRPLSLPVEIPQSAAWSLRRHVAADLDWYRGLFRTVGQDWLWFSHLRMDDEALRAVIHHPPRSSLPQSARR